MKYKLIYTKSTIIDAEDIYDAARKSDEALKQVRVGAVQIEPIFIHEEDDDE